MTCFNLKFALWILSRYCFNSDSIHVKAATKLLYYIKKTLHHNIYYKNKKDSMNYIDADWADAVDNKQSIEIYIYFLFDDFIS